MNKKAILSNGKEFIAVSKKQIDHLAYKVCDTIVDLRNLANHNIKGLASTLNYTKEEQEILLKAVDILDKKGDILDDILDNEENYQFGPSGDNSDWR